MSLERNLRQGYFGSSKKYIHIPVVIEMLCNFVATLTTIKIVKKIACVLILLSSAFVFSCKTAQPTTNPKAPKESYNYTDKQVKGERYVSTINIPVEITMADIERQINANVQGLIYEDNSYDDADTDNFKCKVWKLKDISVTPGQDAFNFAVPLKIWVSYRFSVLGISQIKETEFSINLKFTTKFQIDPTWEAHTETDLTGYDWLSKPVLKLGPIELPIGSIVSKILDSKKEKISKGLDEAVRKNVAIKNFVLQAWNTTLQPYQVSEKYRTWVKVTPVELQMTPFRTLNNRIKATIGIKAYTESVFGDKPVVPSVNNIPNLKLVSSVSDDFQIGLVSEISHSEATRMLSDTMIGQKFEFSNGKYVVEVTAIDLYGSENNLIIKAGLKGSINGNIYFKGVPQYDIKTQTISLQQFDYDLETRSLLLKTANWLLQGRFAKAMQGAFTFHIGSQIEDAKTQIQSSLNKNQVAKGVLLNGKLEAITPDKVYLTPNSIIALVFAKGKVDLKVEGL